MDSFALPAPEAVALNPGEREGLLARMQVLETVLDASTDPIFSILEDGTYQYVNEAFSGAFGKRPGEVIGLRIWDLFGRDEAERRMAVVRKVFTTAEAIVFDVRVPTPAGDTFYITSVKPILDPAGRVTTAVCISKDITKRKRQERDREDLIQRLQAALHQVKTLSGLLPICSHCKKIRDDSGYWTQIEQYIREHSKAEFTHGICPECVESHFSETL